MKKHDRCLRGSKGYCFVWIFLLLPSFGLAQQTSSHSPAESRWSIQIAYGNHSVGFPFQNLFANVNPAISDLGIAFRLNKHPRHQLSLATQSGFVFNSVIGNTLLNGLSLEYAYVHRLGFSAGIDLNMGTILQFYPRETYTLNTQSTAYEAAPGQAIQSGMSGVGFKLAYDFSKRHQQGYTLFLRNKFYFQSPYFQTEAFPVMPQNIIELGMSIKLSQLSNLKK